MKKRFIWIGLYILLTLFIFIRSLQPAAVSSDESRVIVILLERIIMPFLSSPPDNLRELLTILVRKSAHVAEFAALSCIACRIVYAYGQTLKHFFIWVLFSGLFTACVDEAIQLTSEGRAGLITDVFIDFSGTVLGVLISLFILLLISKHRKKA